MARSNNSVFKIFRSVSALYLITVISFTLLCGIFPVRHSPLISRFSNEYGVDKNLVFALIKAESNFSAHAVSRASAKGLMQLTDSTFSHCMQILGRKDEASDIFDTEQNLRAGIWYLAFLINKYGGNIPNAVAAYNAGLTNVDRWLKNPEFSYDGTNLAKIPFPETARHVRKIIMYQKIYSFLY